MADRVHSIENWKDINEVRFYGKPRGTDGRVRGNVVGTITRLDGEIEFHFPASGVTMTPEQAAFAAAHIITLITQP